MYHQCRGSAAETERYAREAIALAADVGFSFWHAGGTVLLGWARVALGDRSGVADVRQGIAAWLATGSRTYHSYYLGLLADALVRLGRADEARAVILLQDALDQALPAGGAESRLLAEGERVGCAGIALRHGTHGSQPMTECAEPIRRNA